MKQGLKNSRTAVICVCAAALLMAAWLFIKLVPQPYSEPDYDGHDHRHGAYLTMLDYRDVTASFTDAGGTVFTLPSGHPRIDGAAELAALAYVSTLPAYELLDTSGGDEITLSEFGLDPPSMEITVSGADGRRVNFMIGDPAPSQTAYYVFVTEADEGVSQARAGVLYLIDAEAGDQLTLPFSAYIRRRLWPGEPGDRPELTRIAVQNGELGYVIERVTAEDDSPYGASYRIAEPLEFLCNADAVRSKVLSGILQIDFDEYVCDADDYPAGEAALEELYGFGARALYLEYGEGGAGERIELRVGGEAPGGGRYLMSKGAVYIDRLGGYGFLDVTPLELTYGVPFWLYRMDDVRSVEITAGTREYWRLDIGDKKYALTLTDGSVVEMEELSARRLFSRILNFSVAGMADEYQYDHQIKIVLFMDGGASHTLYCGSTGNARLLGVEIDGVSTGLACNIKDLQAVLEALETASMGLIIPAS
ncbi:MAG: DUF4340 domain-containing protein [Oscillospiraceae bacterium]|nr:DUF4340 domain-containing protein [Oscillospiraceae bacterium]